MSPKKYFLIFSLKTFVSLPFSIFFYVTHIRVKFTFVICWRWLCWHCIKFHSAIQIFSSFQHVYPSWYFHACLKIKHFVLISWKFSKNILSSLEKCNPTLFFCSKPLNEFFSDKVCIFTYFNMHIIQSLELICSFNIFS